MTPAELKTIKMQWIVSEVNRHLLHLADADELLATKFTVHLTDDWKTLYIEQPTFKEAKFKSIDK